MFVHAVSALINSVGLAARAPDDHELQLSKRETILVVGVACLTPIRLEQIDRDQLPAPRAKSNGSKLLLEHDSRRLDATLLKVVVCVAGMEWYHQLCLAAWVGGGLDCEWTAMAEHS